MDPEGKRIKKSDYTLSIENDELIVTDAENNLFEYNPLNEESRRIQETLFKEKKIIIENCLFGVDINPNSVKICRLRLWIELLKNAYYTAESDYKQLETLPNIDINIKCICIACINQACCYCIFNSLFSTRYPCRLNSAVMLF